MKLILLGAPGAGKGTQAKILSDRLNIPSISTGNILRNAIRNNAPAALRVKKYMDAGQLVPDEIVIDIIRERLMEADCADGYILDGVPRTIAQAETLEQAGIAFDHVISIDVSDEVIINRVSGRRVCERCGSSYHVATAPPKQDGICDTCGGGLIHRKDDEPETVKERLKIYHDETEPLVEFYKQRGCLKRVQSHATIEADTEEILCCLRFCT